MPKATEILRIVRPHFTVRVYESVLRIDLKGSVKNDIEEAFENTPVLKQTIGSILEMFIPLHVHLSDIDSVHMDKRGKVVIKLPRHRDVVIPLEPRDAKRLVDKLNQLVPAAKEKELRRIIKEHRLQGIEKVERELAEEKLSLSGGGAQFPIPEPRGVLEEEKREEEEQEKREPFVSVRGENLEEPPEIKRIFYEAKVYRDGKEVFVSDELRKRLYGVIAFLPIRKILDRGYTPKDRKKLRPREAAAVSMLDERILTDAEFQKEVKDLLLKRVRLEENFPVGELEKDENALYALFYLGHECVKSYIPKKEKESMLEEADEGQVDLREQLYGKKSQKH